ncbi:MAG TPA: peptidoglycan-binding protein [Candidatus Paceibacterota bacterium]|nr:peptidoglycan-binding protein [Candidatus Paceibacterota bacterium]
MNITANNAVSKLFVAFVAAAMLFMLAAPSAKAATVEELQAQIAALMAQIAALSGGSTSGSTAACTFTRSLTVGVSGDDVKCLQNYLTPTYFSNAAGATGYFGPVTQAAVAAWQAANGVTPAAGYFGPVSQAKYSAMASAGGNTGSTGGNTGSTGGNQGGSTSNLSGEADLDDVQIDDADDDTVQEGQDDVQIGQITVKFKNGDARIDRMDIALQGGDDETDPWDTFDKVMLSVDGDEIASMDASDRDNYLNDDEGSLRFSHLDLVANEDDEVVIDVTADLQSGMDDSNDGEAWSLYVGSVRYFDAEDVATTEDGVGDQVSDFGSVGAAASADFTINEAGNDDEIIVKTSSEDPDATTLEVKDDQKSDWYTVFAFDLDTKDSENDIDLNTIQVGVHTPGTSTYNGLVDDAELVIDGTTIDDVTVTGGGTNDATLSFDVNNDVTINAGDRVTAELKLKFKSLASGDEGATIYAEVSSADRAAIDATGADDLAAGQLSGSATGDTHTLRTSGVAVEDFSADTDVTTSDTATNSYGTFTFTFDVTTIGDDEVFIPLTAASTTASGSTTKGAVYKITDANGTTVTASDSNSASLVRISGGDTSTAGYVRLDSGETATLKLTVTFNPTTAGQFIGVLDSVGFAATADPATDSTTLTPSTDYDTDPAFITS